MGFEPTTFGTTIRDSNQLSYTHRKKLCKGTTFFRNDKIFATKHFYCYINYCFSIL